MATTSKLFPVFEVPHVLAEEQAAIQRYRPAPLWDLEKGDFVTDGARKILYGNGFEAWVFWCLKSILTQRFAHLGYGSNAGIEAQEVFAETDQRAAESALTRTITEALLADPMGRTAQVRNFEFEWGNGGESLLVECDIIGVDGNSATIQARISE